jgi:hypothetical protein
VNPEPEHLRKKPCNPVGHHRRAVRDFIEKLNNLARLDRPRIARSPAGEDVCIQNPLYVLGSAAPPLDQAVTIQDRVHRADRRAVAVQVLAA